MDLEACGGFRSIIQPGRSTRCNATWIIPARVPPSLPFHCPPSPDQVPEHMGQLARSHANVTILFMDMVGFTSMANEVAPCLVMT